MESLITVQEYYDSLLGEVNLSANIDGSAIELSFLRQMLDKLEDYGEINEYELNEDGNDSSGRWRIDALSIDNTSEASTGAVSLFISLFDNESHPSNLIKTDLDSVLKKIKKFVEYSLEEDPYTFFEPGTFPFETAILIRQNLKVGANNVRFYVISNRPASSRIAGIPPIEIHGIKAEVIVWDLNRFFQIELSGREREDLVIDLSDRPIKALLASKIDAEMTSVLAAIPATTLIDIYSKWGSRLLEQNVRSFLTTKVKVNKGIRETIKNTPSKFFAFNNGITATAEAASLEEHKDGLYITELKNFQIVNGGQTTASLFSAATKDGFDLSEIFVQMKLSIVSPQKANEIVPFISRYANSQNKVTEADLFSNHPFHVRFENFSRKISPQPKPGMLYGEKWFYERARGQYVNEQAYASKAERLKFQTLNPKRQLITKTALAKYINSFDQIPHIVSKGAEFNFSKFAENIHKLWESSDSDINEGFYKEAIAKAIIFKTIEDLISKYKDTWYRGHRDKLVPYTISYVASALSRVTRDINYEKIWGSQSVSQELQDLYIKVAERVNELMHAPDRPFGNVAEYAKREVFWSVIKTDSISLDINSIQSSTIDLKEKQDVLFYDRLNQRLKTNQEIAQLVKGISSQKWELVRQYLIDTKQENPAKLTLIGKVLKNPAGITDFQCKTLHAFLTDYDSHFRG
jgi:hypothetical protein